MICSSACVLPTLIEQFHFYPKSIILLLFLSIFWILIPFRTVHCTLHLVASGLNISAAGHLNEGIVIIILIYFNVT